MMVRQTLSARARKESNDTAKAKVSSATIAKDMDTPSIIAPQTPVPQTPARREDTNDGTMERRRESPQLGTSSAVDNEEENGKDNSATRATDMDTISTTALPKERECRMWRRKYQARRQAPMVKEVWSST